MSYVIKTGYVINDKPLPISDEADKILHEAAAVVGAVDIGSSLGRAMSLSLLTFAGQASLVEEAMLPS